MIRNHWFPVLAVVVFLLIGSLQVVEGRAQSAPSVAARPGTNAKGGDPVDLGTGLFERSSTDIIVFGAPQVTLKRTYRNRDPQSRPFGIGTNHLYDWFLIGDSEQFKWIQIVLEDGGTIHYKRISPGAGVHDAVFEHVSSPTPFYKSRLKWNGNGFDVNLENGSVYSFGVCGSSDPRNCGIVGIRDPSGRKLRMVREPNTGNLRSVIDSNNAGIEFKYDTSSRVKQAKVIGSSLSVNYDYDRQGRLRRVENLGIVEFRSPLAKRLNKRAARPIDWTEYSYDSAHNMTTMKDSTGFEVINEYDPKNRPIRQSLSDGSKFAFAYTVNSAGKITQTDTTEPDGSVSRVTFSLSGNLLTSIKRMGEIDEIRTVYQRHPVSDHVMTLTINCLSENGEKTSNTRNVKPGQLIDVIERELAANCKRESDFQWQRASLGR